MSESGWKGTPGPWAATTRRGSWDWVVYCASDPNHEVCQTFHDGTDDNELGEANARLIAAAPDLLDHLKRLVRFAEDAPRCDFNEDRTLSWLAFEISEARKIISKAEGKS